MNLDLAKGANSQPDNPWDVVLDDLIKQGTTVAKLVQRKPARATAVRDQIGPQLFRHLCEVANTTSALLSPLVNADYCTVTLKLLWWSGTNAVVHTLLRDAKSYRERDGYRPPNDFDVSANTAFNTLMEEATPSRLFISDNLRLDAALGKYKNSNERWREIYNSTAVVRINNPDNRNTVVGFLCVDSWTWNSAAQPQSLISDILRKLADHVYNTLELIAPSDLKGQKNIGFEVRGAKLSALDASVQLELQSSLEAYQSEFDLDFQRREARTDPLLAGADFHSALAQSGSLNMLVDAENRAAMKSVSRTQRIQNLRKAVNSLTNQDIADRLKPIARKNRYAKKLLERAHKKKLVR